MKVSTGSYVSRLRSSAWPLLLASGLIGGCATLPQPEELRDSVAVYPGGTLPTALDGRARFREIFCSLAESDHVSPGEAASCEELLWSLNDEPAPSSGASAPPSLAPRLRIFVVSGAFGDCRGIDTIPYGTEIQHLAAQGVQIEAVMVSGRSSPERNASQLADVIRHASVGPGTASCWSAIPRGPWTSCSSWSDFPDLGRQVVAVVSVAGAIYGSPLATRADWWYRTLFAIVREDVRPRRWPGHRQPRTREATTVARRAPAADPRCLLFAGRIPDRRTLEPRAECDVAHPCGRGSA